MVGTLDQYAEYIGHHLVEQLHRLAAPMRGMKVLHVNSTQLGGGVAEILHRLVPLKRELGLDVSWEVISGDAAFYACTKGLHNTIQGMRLPISDNSLKHFEAINATNYERLASKLREADIVFIHDPQPAPLLNLCTDRKGKWIWRCHIDASQPYRPVWKYLSRFIEGYNASIYSLPAFAQRMEHPSYIISPSIDPLSEKNIELDREEIDAVYRNYGLDPDRPIITQVSRFDRFKDPVGVVQTYRIVKEFVPQIQLVLAGGTATDDPEGEEVLAEVTEAAQNDPDIHVLLLPPDAHRTINALQRVSTIVLQKSLKEGFGLTVTEALWKGRPVVAGDVGGIRLQVMNHYTGFLVNTPEGAAMRIRYLLKDRQRLEEMGEKARLFVRDNFLLTRHLREYLTVMLAVLRETRQRIHI